MTRILLTNDDGIQSKGLIKLEEALSQIGDVFVVAPASEMSGASHSLTLARPLRIRQIDSRHWTVDGTPTDCVTLALNKILSADEMPDICASGINHGGNLGDDATYSGTVAGALEATILDGTDYNAIEQGYISVTPLKSDMTDHNALTAIETWNYVNDAELLHKS